MARLGLHRGYVVHGSDGLGELTITGPSSVFAIQHGVVTRIELSPADFGLELQSVEGIQGGNAECNRAIAETVLNGGRGPARDIVLMNSALALVAASHARNFLEGVDQAAESIDTGSAIRKLNGLRELLAQERSA